MEKTFTIDLWKHVNIETVDDALDEAIKRTHKVAVDIEFECLSVTKSGALRLKATYVPEKY